MGYEKELYSGGENMHPNFWLIIFCAVVASLGGIAVKKKNKKK